MEGCPTALGSALVDQVGIAIEHGANCAGAAERYRADEVQLCAHGTQALRELALPGDCGDLKRGDVSAETGGQEFRMIAKQFEGEGRVDAVALRDFEHCDDSLHRLRANFVKGVRGQTMMRFATLLVLLLGQAGFAQTIEKEFVYEGKLRVSCWPGFDNGYLIVYDTGGRITLRPPNGAAAITVSAGDPVAGVPMSNAAVDTDGFIAATVNMGSVWGLVLFRPDGKQERFIETTPFAPGAVRFGPDHTIWTALHQYDHTQTHEPDFAILRNYGRDGRGLSITRARTMFDVKLPSLSNNYGFPLLHVAAGWIGVPVSYTHLDVYKRQSQSCSWTRCACL